MLIELIREAGGHRFRHLAHYKKSDFGYNYYYACCQDDNKSLASESTGKRDRRRMKRFDCKSKLVMQLDLLDRRLFVKLQHDYHTPYTDVRLSQEALGFVNSQCMNKTPAELYRDLQASSIPGAEIVAQHQVYYQWQRANSSIWRHDSDQFLSMSKFLDLHMDLYWHETYTAGNLRAQAIYIRGTISSLVSSTQELVIDATFGTNNSGNI